MQCPRCQQENPGEARFCLKCGAGLTLACGGCGTELPIGAAFCFACGRPVVAPPAAGGTRAPEVYTPKHLAEKILASRGALEGERKQVTVLFVDVSGFTSLSERVDPEEVHRLMTGAFEVMLAEVHRYEGTVNQFLGDGIMALFGAPIAHEDHARRAEATEDYLALVADGLPASPVLLVLTYRTGHSHPFGERSYQSRVAPGALSAGDTVVMARAMLAAERLPDGLQALIARKADGNPFFIEELVKSLREAGSIRPGGDGWVLTQRLDDLVVPDTIQDVIAARIDRLAEGPKRALQAASVIGRRFNRRLLDRIVESGASTETLLRDLVALELIHETRVFPESEYTFKHALTQEVAYGSLLGRRRKGLHRLIAATIEDLHRDRLGEQYEVLAHHFDKAEVWDKALEYLMQAADKAARAFATRDAIALYDVAEATVDRAGVPLETRMTIHRRRAELYVLVSDFDHARAESEDVLRLARQSEDRHAEGEALAGMGLASLLGHHFDQCLDDSRQVAEIAEAIDDPSILAGGLWQGSTSRGRARMIARWPASTRD